MKTLTLDTHDFIIAFGVSFAITMLSVMFGAAFIISLTEKLYAWSILPFTLSGIFAYLEWLWFRLVTTYCLAHGVYKAREEILEIGI